MAALMEVNTGMEINHEEDLSDEQINALLQGAEDRLRQQVSRPASRNITTLPTLKAASNSTKPCIIYSGGKATVDPAYIAQQHGSTVIDHSKMVETTEAKKQRIKEVRSLLTMLFTLIEIY